MIATASPEVTSPPEWPATAVPWTATAGSLDEDKTKRLVAALPEQTFELLVREAYLFRAGEVISKAMKEARARHEVVSESRPPFLAFRRAETKDAFKASLAAATDDLSLYDRAVKRNGEAMKRLRKCAELHIEAWLREHDEAYHAGLVSESLVADWHRCIKRLEAGLMDFVAAVGAARNSLVSSVADAQGVRYVSDVSRKAILHAAKVGALLVVEVKATNELAAERDRRLHGTAFESSFPRLPTFDFAGSLREAVVLPVPFLQEQFGRILDRCAELNAIGLPALVQQVQQAEAQHTAVKESYLIGVWQSVREFALVHYVDEGDLTAVAHATEEMFERGAFA